MDEADTRALGTLLGVAALLGLAWLVSAVWIALDEQRERAELAAAHADVAAWEISRLLQEARDITRLAALEQGDRAAD